MNPAMNVLTAALGSLVGPVLDIFKKKTTDKDKALEAQTELRKLELQEAPKSYLRLWMSFLGWVLAICFVYAGVIQPVLAFYFPKLPLPQLPLELLSRLLLGMLGIAL